jgi:hypothetical protein
LQPSNGDSRQGLRLVAIYLGAFALSTIALLVLVLTQSGEYIAYAPIVAAGFSLPWSIAAFVLDHSQWSTVIVVGGIVLNAVLLYRLGTAAGRRVPQRPSSRAT